MSRFRAVVFDCYQTLVSLPTDGRERAFDDLAQRLGLSLPPGELHRRWRQMGRELGPNDPRPRRPPLDGPVASFRSFGDLWLERFGEFFRRLNIDAEPSVGVDAYVRAHTVAVPFPDVRPALEALRGHYRLAVLSDADTSFLEASVASTGVSFDVVLSSEEVGAYKPHVSIFREMSRRLEVGPSGIVYVGDGLWSDVAGAKNAGMAAVWLNRESRARAEEDAAPDWEIASLEELPALLEAQRAGES